MSLAAFWEYVRTAQLRIYQERSAVLDLCYSGWSGMLLATLLVAVVVVFLLSIFHVIPARRHVTGLLLGIGFTAAVLGFASSYFHASHLPEVESQLFRLVAPQLASGEQKAAVVVLPLVVGSATLAIGVVGCAYMAIFWATSRPEKK